MEEEEYVATLIYPDDYLYNLNQVAGLTAKNIIFLKRKFISKSGFELIRYPISDCQSVRYQQKRSILRIVSGALVVLLICFIFYIIVAHSEDLAGMRIKLGLFGIALIAGLRWIFGSRGHKLEFMLRDNIRLIWKSRAGDFENKMPAVNNVINFAKSKGILAQAQ